MVWEVIVTGLSLLNLLSSLKSVLPHIRFEILLQLVELLSFQPIFAASVIIPLTGKDIHNS